MTKLFVTAVAMLLAQTPQQTEGAFNWNLEYFCKFSQKYCKDAGGDNKNKNQPLKGKGNNDDAPSPPANIRKPRSARRPRPPRPTNRKNSPPPARYVFMHILCIC